MVKKKSGIVFNLLIILVLVVGVGLLAYPTVSNWWNTVHASRAIAQYNEMVDAIDAAEVQEMLDAARAYNRDLVMDSQRFTPSEEDSARYDSLLDISGTGIMGYVEIPKISVDLPIYHGTEDSILQVAVGHIEGSSLPVGGKDTHVAISGHCGLPSAKLFTKLDTLEEGDLFSVNVLGETLSYEVDQISVVLPDNFSPLEFEDGQDQVTLITCTPYGVNSHRLMVRGSRVS
jgi:sortase A